VPSAPAVTPPSPINHAPKSKPQGDELPTKIGENADNSNPWNEPNNDAIEEETPSGKRKMSLSFSALKTFLGSSSQVSQTQPSDMDDDGGEEEKPKNKKDAKKKRV